MSVRVMRVYEYVIECDKCGWMDIYHTGDEDRGIKIHTVSTAMRASGFHRRKRKLLCPICFEKEKEAADA